MPIIGQQPIDLQWIVILVSSATIYQPKEPAIVAATTLSAANSNAIVQLAQVQETVTSPAAPGLPNVQMPGIGTPLFLVQLQSATTYYPLETARTQALATSASNSNAPVYIARVIETVTAP